MDNYHAIGQGPLRLVLTAVAFAGKPLSAATARIGVATADLFPKFKIKCARKPAS